jgi:hypothetical protein
MQAGIRIIKRGAQDVRSDVAASPVAKSDRERERETVVTVKTWIAEWHERKRSLQAAADLIIRSLGTGRESPTNRSTVLN